MNDFIGQTVIGQTVKEVKLNIKSRPGPKLGKKQKKKRVRDTVRQGEKSEIIFAHKVSQQLVDYFFFDVAKLRQKFLL